MLTAGKRTPSSRSSTSSMRKKAEGAVQAGISEAGINSLAHTARAKLSTRALPIHATDT